MQDPTQQGWWSTFASINPSGANDLRNQFAQQMATGGGSGQPQQALSGGTVQYSAPSAPSSQPLKSDAEYYAMGMSPTDIMLYKQALQGKPIPTGVAGPYGGGAMGQPQISSGYNPFSGAGLAQDFKGGQGLYGGGYDGSSFFGGGSNPYSPQQQQTPFQQRFQGAPDTPFDQRFQGAPYTGQDFNERFPGGGGSGSVPYQEPYNGGGYLLPSYMNPNPGS
jgi:hypothetical protein